MAFAWPCIGPSVPMHLLHRSACCELSKRMLRVRRHSFLIRQTDARSADRSFALFRLLRKSADCYLRPILVVVRTGGVCSCAEAFVFGAICTESRLRAARGASIRWVIGSVRSLLPIRRHLV